MSFSFHQTLSNNRHGGDSLLLVAALLGTVSFASGVVYASYAMRLRDRERLRRACSRIEKHLETSQRMALGPISSLMKTSSSKEKILVVGAGSYGTYVSECLNNFTMLCSGFVL